MKKLVCAFLFLLALTEFSAQDKDNPKYKTKILLKWNPTSLLGYSAIQFAAEVSYKRKKSFQIEYGVISPKIGYGRDGNKGYRVRLEHRFFINEGENFYIAPEIHVTAVKYNTTKRFSQNWKIDSISGEKYTYDTYLDDVGIIKQAFSGNAKVGFQYVFRKPELLFDVYLGLGVRYVKTRFSSYPTVGEYVPPIDNWFDNYDYKESNRFLPNAVIGIKVGYRIRLGVENETILKS